jgi:hypothetical protein
LVVCSFLIIGYGKAAVGRVWCQLEEQATTNEYAIKFQCLPTGPGGVAEVIVAATHEDTIDDIKGKIVAEVNRDDFSKHGFRVMRNGKYCDELWRRVLEYGTGPAIWSIVIKLRGGAAKATKKDMKKERATKLNDIKAHLAETTSTINDDVKALPSVKATEALLCEFMANVDSQPNKCIEALVKRLDLDGVGKVLETANAKGGATDDKIEKISQDIFGHELAAVINMKGSLDSVIDSAKSVLVYGFTKASDSEDGYNIGQFKKMVETCMAEKRGAIQALQSMQQQQQEQ